GEENFAVKIGIESSECGQGDQVFFRAGHFVGVPLEPERPRRFFMQLLEVAYFASVGVEPHLRELRRISGAELRRADQRIGKYARYAVDQRIDAPAWHASENAFEDIALFFLQRGQLKIAV